MAEQNLGQRTERLAAAFDGTEVTEAFSGNDGFSYKTPIGTIVAKDNGTETTEVPTNAQRDGRDNVFTGDNSFVGSRYVPVTVTADHTISGESEVIVNTDASTTVAITIPSGLPIGTRKKITRIGAYDTTNTNRVRLLPSGTEYITAGRLTDVPIYGNGGTWEVQKVGSLRWEIVGGYDRGSNSNGRWLKAYDGELTQQAWLQVDVTSATFQSFGFPISDFVGSRGDVASSFSHLSASASTALRLDSMTKIGNTDVIWFLVLLSSATSTDPTSFEETLSAIATGRWYEEV